MKDSVESINAAYICSIIILVIVVVAFIAYGAYEIKTGVDLSKSTSEAVSKSSSPTNKDIIDAINSASNKTSKELLISGIHLLVLGPIGAILLWFVIKPVFGLFYDAKMLKYQIVDSNSDKSDNELKNFELDLNFSKPHEKYVFKNAIIIIQNHKFGYYINRELNVSGIVKISDKKIELVSEKGTMALKIVDDGLQAESGIVYKKVASN